MTKLAACGNGVTRETCVTDRITGKPLCVELGPRFLTLWPKGTRRKYVLPIAMAYERAAKLAAGYEDPPADRRRRREYRTPDGIRGGPGS